MGSLQQRANKAKLSASFVFSIFPFFGVGNEQCRLTETAADIGRSHLTLLWNDWEGINKLMTTDGLNFSELRYTPFVLFFLLYHIILVSM